MIKMRQESGHMGWMYEDENINEVESNKFLTFMINEQHYGIAIENVIEIISMLPISAVPEFGQNAKGIINLRDKVIPVIDVRLCFHLPEKEYNDRTCIIITGIGGLDIGFIVDAVSEVVDISQTDIEEPPQLGTGYAHRFINGVAKKDNKMILLVDGQKLISEEALNAISAKQIANK